MERASKNFLVMDGNRSTCHAKNWPTIGTQKLPLTALGLRRITCAKYAIHCTRMCQLFTESRILKKILSLKIVIVSLAYLLEETGYS